VRAFILLVAREQQAPESQRRSEEACTGLDRYSFLLVPLVLSLPTSLPPSLRWFYMYMHTQLSAANPPSR